MFYMDIIYYTTVTAQYTFTPVYSKLQFHHLITYSLCNKDPLVRCFWRVLW